MGDPKVHPGIPQGWDWIDREGNLTCSFCGSMSVEMAIYLLHIPGTPFSGSDWKYGWPHKFYIGPGMFYAVHLRDCSDTQLEEFSELSSELMGVYWNRNETGLYYRALSPGWQTWGVTGQAPLEGAPIVPSNWKNILNPTIH